MLCLLGYGSLAALANDPRVNPRAWQEGNDVDATHEQLQPNCGVSCFIRLVRRNVQSMF